MQLIGMLDSPYVRRSFICARLLGVPFEHRALSVFRDFAEFHAINPLVKAPTLRFDDGSVLVDSSLILRELEDQAGRSLLPEDADERRRCRRIESYALAMCDKAVQLYYEIGLRPEALRWSEWITRVTGQLRDSAGLLEKELAPAKGGWLFGDAPSLGEVSAAVAWRFAQYVLPGVLPAADYPRLIELSRRAEALEAFRAADFAEDRR